MANITLSPQQEATKLLTMAKELFQSDEKTDKTIEDQFHLSVVPNWCA